MANNVFAPHMYPQQHHNSAHDESVLADFACADLNELWAAAVPALLREDTAENSTGSSPDASSNKVPDSTVETEETQLDEEEGKEVAFSPPTTNNPSSTDHHHQPPLHRHHHHAPTTATRKPGRTLTAATLVEYVKYTYSSALLAFCILVVSAAIVEKQTTATGDYDVHPFFAFVLFWCLILWLALMEGGLNCMVGLKPIDKSLYAKSHPKAFLCTNLAHRGDNLERFIVGRQFLDLMCVFLTNFMVSSIDDASVLGLPDGVSRAFLGSGLAVILVTIVIGQLVSQINAAHCMLDFINNWVMVATTYAALTLEGSGLLHAVYLIQISVAKCAGKRIESAEASSRTTLRKVWFWFRVVLSTGVLMFAFVVTFTALFNGQTTMWSNVPAAASLFLLIGLILICGNMEALQIAMFAVVHLPEGELIKHPVAHRNCQFTFQGSHLQAFLVGRQIFQTIIMFMIARITTLDVGENESNIFGVSDGVQTFFNTGILGALISTIVASLSWRILASTFPLAFLSNPLASVTIRFCLLVEYTGVCAVSWLIAVVQKRLARYQVDEVYVGTAAERSAAAAAAENEHPDLAEGTSSDSEE